MDNFHSVHIFPEAVSKTGCCVAAGEFSVQKVALCLVAHTHSVHPSTMPEFSLTG